MENEIKTTVAKGVAGVLAAIGGAGVSVLPQVEQWLRITSLALGCAVAIYTIVAIRRGKK